MRCVITEATIRIEVSGQRYEATLPAQPVRIGAGEACELRIAATGVASEQCVITPLRDGRHAVKDLGSGQATVVNGTEIQQVSLTPGDVIALGEAQITYAPDLVAPPAPTPPPQAIPARPSRAPAVAHRTQPPARGGRDLTKPLVALAAAALVAGALAFVIGGGSNDGAAAAERKLEIALDLYREQDYDAAADALRILAADHGAGAVAAKADRYLQQTQSAIAEAEAALELMWDRRLDVDVSSIATRREVFLQQHGAYVAERFDRQVERIGQAQATWAEEEIASARREAEARLAGGRFGDAVGSWRALRQKATPGVRFDAAVVPAIQVIETEAGTAASRVLQEAESLSTSEGPARAVVLLQQARGAYEGTAAHARLSQALRRYQAEVREKLASGRVERPTDATGPTVPPPTAGPSAALLAKVADTIAQADEIAAQRDFEGAIARLDQAKLEGEGTEPLAARRRDLMLAIDGFQALVDDINQAPERYVRVEMGPKFVVALQSADREGVKGKVPGGSTMYRWNALSADRIGRILARMKPKGEPAMAVASLARELGLAEAVDPHLVAAVKGGAPTSDVFATLARWRGEDVPVSGYVEYGGRFVTPTERDRLVLEARIADAAKRVAHRDPKVWQAAVDELVTLGDPAREALITALTSRRTSLFAALATDKAFTSGRTKAWLYEQLQTRRKAAFALIRDERAWPYPNPTKQNTAEVAELVAAVRQVWEAPFDLVVEKDAGLAANLAEIEAIDKHLERADPGYAPDFDAVQRINIEVDMPTYTPDGTAKGVRAYSLDVLAYNEKVQTTATREEKDNVRIVNEYRMMMGLHALKINERLTRAARGHSRHMKENEYFAHDVPAPYANASNKSPGHRAKTQGYGGGVGENIARGTWTGRDAFWAWFHSSGHHRNMVNPGWTEMGAGRSSGSWWTQLFGRASGKSLKAPAWAGDPDPAVAPEPEDDSGRPLKPARPEVPDDTAIPEDQPGETEGR